MPEDVQNAADLRKIIDSLPDNVVMTPATAPITWMEKRDRETIEDALIAIRSRVKNPDAETDFELAARFSNTDRLSKAVGKAANISRFKPITKITKIGEGTPA